MRIVTKTNLALVGVVSLSAVLNFGVLQWTIMPRFMDIETDTAQRNQSRAIEAIQVQTDQVAASSRDYAFWDDSYAFMQDEAPDYEATNISAESLEALSVNYFLAVDEAGGIKLDRGFDHTDEEPEPVKLLQEQTLAIEHPFRRLEAKAESQQGLIRTELGIAAVGYSPVLTSERQGPSRGTLVFGKLLDIDALRQATKVDFDILPASTAQDAQDGATEMPDVIETRTVLNDIEGKPIAVLVSRTDRVISSTGRQAIWVALSLLAVGGILLVATLAMLLRRIVIARVERLRSHLVTVGSTGSLAAMPRDEHGDELSQTVESFNSMAAQLAELRDALRRKDYSHGAADQAAGLLHNVRNAVSPISTVTWELLQSENAPWKQNLAKAVDQLSRGDIAPDRAEKLNQFVTLSVAKLLEETEARRSSLEALGSMVRHVDGILKDADAVSHGERTTEVIDVASCAASAAAIIREKTGITLVADVPAGARVLGHKFALEQVMANLLVNAAEAISATRADGTITLTVQDLQLEGTPALDIRITDNGEGIPSDRLERIFEKGFSTRRERSSGLGLHWCANAVNAMKGRLFAESEGPGSGATLHIVLPIAASELKVAA